MRFGKDSSGRAGLAVGGGKVLEKEGDASVRPLAQDACLPRTID